MLAVVGVLTFVVGLIAGAATIGSPTSVGSVLIGIAVYTIIASFGALTLAILYFDLRAREAGPRPSPAIDDQRPALEDQHVPDADRPGTS